MTTRRSILALSLAIVGGLAVVTGCSSEPSAPSAAAPSASAAPATGPGVSAGPTSAADGCGGAVERVARHLTGPPVEAVTVEGQCTSIVIGTTLGDGDTAPATQLCDAAAEVAYAGDVNSVSVLSRSGTELSVGISGANCLPSG